MKRLWLTWDGNKITAAWKGRMWKVAMDGDPLSSSGFKLYMRAKGKTDVVVPWDWDMAHKNRPEWVDVPETWQDAQEAAVARAIETGSFKNRNLVDLAGLLSGSGLSDQEAFDAAEDIFAEAARMNVSPEEVLRMAAQEALA